MAFPRRAAVMLAFLIGLFGAISVQAGSYDESLLWRIERDGVAPGYLLGTIHSDDERVLNLPEKTEIAFVSAQRYVMEMVVDQQAQAQIQQAMMLPPGQQLPALLGDELWSRLKALLAQRGLPPQAAAMFKPWAAAMILSYPQASKPFLDLHLSQRARARGVNTLGLETAPEQLGLFDRLDDQQQLSFVRETVDMVESGDMASYFEQITVAYTAGDLAELLRLTDALNASSEDAALTEYLMRELVDVRNVRMAERLGPLFRQGGTFAAVGALHLPGENGVLSLLAKAGWRLTPVR